MTGLLTPEQFRRIRQETALSAMLERLPILAEQCKELEHEYRRLRHLLLRETDRNKREALEYELYIEPSGEYGDNGGVAWQWAKVDAEIGDIERDARYQRHMELIKVTDGMMEAFGAKRITA